MEPSAEEIAAALQRDAPLCTWEVQDIPPEVYAHAMHGGDWARVLDVRAEVLVGRREGEDIILEPLVAGLRVTLTRRQPDWDLHRRLWIRRLGEELGRALVDTVWYDPARFTLDTPPSRR